MTQNMLRHSVDYYKQNGLAIVITWAKHFKY